MHRLKGFIELVFDVVEETTNLVERTHKSTAQRSIRRFAPVEPLRTPAHAVNATHELVASGVYAAIRTVNEGVRLAFNLGFRRIDASVNAPLDGGDISRHSPDTDGARTDVGRLLDHAQGGLVGLHGDWLRQRRNALATTMHLRHKRRPLPTSEEAFREAFPAPSNKICVFVHGLGCTEQIWRLGARAHYGDPAVTFGARLREEHGYAPLYVRYNTGLHVSENGRNLSELLSEVVANYPIEIVEIALVGHSMGGLVSRSAGHFGRLNAESWVPKLRHVFSIGAPNLGAPLEKTVNVVAGSLRVFDTAATDVISQVLNARSVGIKDMRFGYTTDEEWQGYDPDAVLEDRRDNIPLLDHVGYYFIASTVTEDPQHPVGQVVGDLLVRLPSAAGRDPEPLRCIPFESGQVLGGIRHLQLANHPAVYDVISRWVQVSAHAPFLLVRKDKK